MGSWAGLLYKKEKLYVLVTYMVLAPGDRTAGWGWTSGGWWLAVGARMAARKGGVEGVAVEGGRVSRRRERIAEMAAENGEWKWSDRALA